MDLRELPIDWSRVGVGIVTAQYAPIAPAYRSEAADNKSLDALIHLNTRILKTKLETMASTIEERLKIRRQNLDRIEGDREKTSEMVQQISVAANYHLRDHREKGTFYQKLFELTKERRDQDTDCWRDVVLALRDLLTFWDEYERAKARGEFLSDV